MPVTSFMVWYLQRLGDLVANGARCSVELERPLGKVEPEALDGRVDRRGRIDHGSERDEKRYQVVDRRVRELESRRSAPVVDQRVEVPEGDAFGRPGIELCRPGRRVVVGSGRVDERESVCEKTAADDEDVLVAKRGELSSGLEQSLGPKIRHRDLKDWDVRLGPHRSEERRVGKECRSR